MANAPQAPRMGEEVIRSGFEEGGGAQGHNLNYPGWPLPHRERPGSVLQRFTAMGARA